MSWSKKVVGKKEAIKENVDADAYVPDVVKGAIGAVLDQFSVPDGTAVLLETSGHLSDPDSGTWSNCRIDLSTVAKAVKAAAVMLLACLLLFAASPAQAAETVNNRLRGTISREFSDFGKLTDQGEYQNAAGLNYEHLFSDLFGMQFDAFRSFEDPDSWQGSADLTWHLGALVLQGGAGYDDPTEDYLVNVGAGFDHCSGSYCAQIVLRYYRDLESGDETEGTDLDLGESHHLSLGIGFGFGW